MTRARTRTTMMAGLLLGVVLLACSDDTGQGNGDAAVAAEIAADLRADANRDGDVRFDDDSDVNKTEWNQSHGAIFLANIDDDSERCRIAVGEDDTSIATCNDADDDIVNGEDDAADLARLRTRPLPNAPKDAAAKVSIDPESARDKVRVFRRIGPGPTDLAPIVVRKHGLDRPR